jgi:protein-S-isoprenylcysteine O-methyltransferase Ste14
MPEGAATIIGLFLAYFIIHSITASLWLKGVVSRHLPALVPYYRLLFNALSMLLAIPLVYVVWRYPGEPLWQWQGFAFYIANALALLAVVAFVYSLKMYDMAEFWGMRQLRERVGEVKEMEQFKVSPFHRYVRHPWYTMALVLLWSRDMTSSQLLTYSLLTLYLVVGSRLEERKLIAYHGEVYRRYRRRVPGLLPLPWKHLSRAEAEQLVRHGQQHQREEER